MEKVTATRVDTFQFVLHREEKTRYKYYSSYNEHYLPSLYKCDRSVSYVIHLKLTNVCACTYLRVVKTKTHTHKINEKKKKEKSQLGFFFFHN